ncbi:MAG: hypothetical protein K0B15_00885 [Lentimicrobium sp.]|nr:hypothetical protein [Lentimicrobium sp.]
MKKLFLIVLALPLLLASCENKKQTEKIMQLETEHYNLMRDAASKDSLINDFLLTLNEIESNLTEIRTREKLISSKTDQGQELSKPAREQINADIRLINELMQENKNKVAELNRKLKESSLKISEFENMVANVNSQLAERDAEIISLKNDLTNLNFSIASLNDTISQIKDQNRNLSNTITRKTDELNVAHFIVGEKKSLIEKQILNKEGGFLGIGRTQKVTGDVNLDEFTQVDIRNLTSIPLGVKKASLITTHPAGSYELVESDKKIQELIIKDAQKFWEKSRLLVISTEN